ncbi:MAG: hypothetical protein ACYSSI_04880 [Planctomycetota bacterium]|jgi:hypothetical protein
MVKKVLESNMKFYLLVLLSFSLLFLASCKKKTDSGPSDDKPVKTENKSQDENTTRTNNKKNTVSGKAGMIVLPTELPKPMFVGTPSNLQIKNLEKPIQGDRPPFYVPAGTKNVALNKSVSASEEDTIIGEISMVTDGDKEATDGSYVELYPGPQHVTIDLGAKHDIYAILLWHYHKQARVYFDVIVQLADDPDFIMNVRTLFNNDHDNSAGLGVGKDMHYIEDNKGRLIDAKGLQARYVRLYSNGSNSDDLNHYIEVEVFGKPAK